jgi:hypothetical protein
MDAHVPKDMLAMKSETGEPLRFAEHVYMSLVFDARRRLRASAEHPFAPALRDIERLEARLLNSSTTGVIYTYKDTDARPTGYICNPGIPGQDALYHGSISWIDMQTDAAACITSVFDFKSIYDKESLMEIDVDR